MVILFPTVNSYVGFVAFERTNENRVFRDSLDFNINNLDYFPPQAEEYFNDNFSVRTPLLDVYRLNKRVVFSISPHPEKTIIGKNGWYFISQKEQRIYEGDEEFSQTQLADFSTMWKTRKQYLDSLNIVSYWVISPMKHYVYGEELRFNIEKKSGPSRVDVLESYLENEFSDFIIDPRNQFESAKDTMDLYYKLDNHWNRRAGFIVSQMILKKLKPDFPSLLMPKFEDYYWVDTTYKSGFHRNVMGLESSVEEDLFPIDKNELSLAATKYGFPVTPEFPYENDFEKVYRNKSYTTLPKILIIRDSFGDMVIPFLKEPFSESVFIFDGWNYGLNKEIIETVKPDIVIFLGLETHLEHYIER